MRQDIAQSSGVFGSILPKQEQRWQTSSQQLGELAGGSDRTLRDIEAGAGRPALRSVLSVLTVLGLQVAVTP